MMQKALHNMVSEWYNDFKQDKYAVGFTIALLVALFGYGGFKAKQWYVEHQEGAAQLVFSEALNEYDRVLYSIKEGTVEEKQWNDVELAFKEVEDNHGGTTYAVYAQAFQADILARQGETKQALELLGSVIKRLSVASPAYYLFKTKHALLQLDAGQEAEALKALQALAGDYNNKNSDTAAFFLGYYYWTHDKVDQARTAWKQFDKSELPKEHEKVSPWASLVHMKLSQLTP